MTLIFKFLLSSHFNCSSQKKKIQKNIDANEVDQRPCRAKMAHAPPLVQQLLRRRLVPWPVQLEHPNLRLRPMELVPVLEDFACPWIRHAIFEYFWPEMY